MPIYGGVLARSRDANEPEVAQASDDPAASASSGGWPKWSSGSTSRLRQRVSVLMLAAAEAIASWPSSTTCALRGDEEQGGHTLALLGGWPRWWEHSRSRERSDRGASAQFPRRRSGRGGRPRRAFGPSTDAPVAEDEPRTPEEEIASLVAAVCSGMRSDVTRLGDRLRNPTVMSDPWMLIQDLLEFRGRVRAALGELIFPRVCTLVMEVERETVVPGYVSELSGSLLVRQATTNLAFLFRGHARRVGAASEDRIVTVLQDALKDVHAFLAHRALPQLRTSDKRIFLETRATLYRLAKVQPAPTLEIRQAVENLARFLDSLSVVSRRESLRLHDRAQLARAGRHLEAAAVQPGNAGGARGELGTR